MRSCANESLLYLVQMKVKLFRKKIKSVVKESKYIDNDEFEIKGTVFETCHSTNFGVERSFFLRRRTQKAEQRIVRSKKRGF